MNHASGYNFNATNDMVMVNAHKVLFYSYQLIIRFVLNAALTVEDHGIKRDVKPIVDFLKGLISIHQDRIVELYKNHNKVDPNKIN